MSALLRNIRLPWLIFTLLVFALLVKLAWWQNQRADEKQQRLQRIAAYAQQQALTLPQLLSIARQQQGNAEAINDISLALPGRFDSDHVFLLDNQTNNGRLGYRVLQVFHVGGQALLINLGWVPGSVDRSKLPELQALSGSHQLTGHVRVPEAGIVLQQQEFNEVSWPLRIEQIDIDKISALIAVPLLPFVVYLDKKETIGFEKNWQPIVMPPEKHRAYAFQWLSLAIAWLCLMLWAAWKNNNNKGENR